MNQSDIKTALSEYFAIEAPKRAIDLAFLYGSWAADRARKDSDVDIAVLFSERTRSETKKFKHVIEVSAALSRAVGKEVNVVCLNWNFEKPMLYYNASVHAVPLYIKDPSLYLRFLREAVAQMEEFCIFGVACQLAAARANLRGTRHA